jgi:hypothetical protein
MTRCASFGIAKRAVDNASCDPKMMRGRPARGKLDASGVVRVMHARREGKTTVLT